MVARVLAAALLSLATIGVSGAPFAEAATAYRTGTLPDGATYYFDQLGKEPVAAIALWFRAPAQGFDPTAQPGLSRLAATAVAASQPVTGTSLVSFVDGIGGRLTIQATPDTLEVSAVVPADQAAATVRAFTRSYFAPVVTDAGLGDAGRAELIRGEMQAASAQEQLDDALYGALFTSGPAKYPNFSTAAAISATDTTRIRTFAERAFRPTNAILIVTGDVDQRVLADAIPGQVKPAAGAEPPAAEQIAPNPAPVHITAAQPGFGLAWAGPPITDERAATALDFVVDYLFTDRGPLNDAAHRTGSDIEGNFLTYHDPGVFLVTATGGDLTAARADVEKTISALQRPLSPALFDAARTAFVYHTFSDSQTPGELADSYGWYAAEGDVGYAPGVDGNRGRYVTDASGLTPQFVAATVAKYLGHAGASVTATTAVKSST